MGGFKSEIADGIRMFKPRTLKEAISLAKMRDEQLARTRRFTQPPPLNRISIATSPVNHPIPANATKRLSWDEMQERRAQGLCFNCNDINSPLDISAKGLNFSFLSANLQNMRWKKRSCR